jgi:thioredoxin-dependent peroxiredoxin
MPGAMDGTKARIPTELLIDEAGVIRDRFDGKDIGDHIPFERVEAFIEA